MYMYFGIIYSGAGDFVGLYWLSQQLESVKLFQLEFWTTTGLHRIRILFVSITIYSFIASIVVTTVSLLNFVWNDQTFCMTEETNFNRLFLNKALKNPRTKHPSS